MDFNEIAESCEIPVAKFSIKNKGSVVKLGTYYAELYNALIEKWNLICKETRYVHNEISADGATAVEWDWVAYKTLDNFSRLRFDCSTLTWYVKGDKAAGKFSVKYTIELDYNKTWRNSMLLKSFLPNYLKLFYQNTILQWIDRYLEELNGIKEKVNELLNINV
ncbi:MAG: hypothetical protein JW791_05335 [Nanoarchaeota archaeon]|nr:hypothetical protein [Nanoarchaeota archaeon]